MKIYELVHMHRAEVLSDGRFHCGDIAILGFFKSLDEVSTTIKFYKTLRASGIILMDLLSLSTK